MAPVEPELKDRAEQAALAARAFSELFYEGLDKKRHALKNLYLDSANLLWNGHAITGQAAVIKFLEDLPTSQTTLNSLDSQPVHASAIETETIVVTTFGKVVFKDSKPKSFYQTFLLSSQANVWKIVSDNFRFLESSDPTP